MDHVKKEALGSKQIGHVDIHDGLQKERKLNDPEIEMLAQTESIGKRAVDERVTLCHNLCVVIQSQHELGIETDFSESIAA